MSRIKPEREHEGYLEIPMQDYIVLPFTETAIHKRAFLYNTFITTVFTSVLWAVGLWTDWYSVLAATAIQVLLTYWFLAVGFTALGIIFIYINYWSGKRNKGDEH